MLAVATIQLDFDLYLPHEPTPVPVFDRVDSESATATLIKGTRLANTRGLTESAACFQAGRVESHNHLEIVFSRAEFDRSDASVRDLSDAKVERVANNFISRLAYFFDAPGIALVQLESCAWKLDYLNDDRSELLAEDGKFRGRESMSATFGPMIRVGNEFWTEFSKLPRNFTVPAWHPLLTQAERVMPDVGNALLLTAIALEVFVEIAISEHARNTSIPAELWNWIATRNAGRGPSISDQYSVLLNAVCGHTLKESTRLWTALRNILEARNSFAHTGQARILDRPVAESSALDLIAAAREIIKTVNTWLHAHGRAEA